LPSFVGLHRWVEILERHFPPDLSDPNRANGHVGTSGWS
jgi:hypothetical protein